MSVAKSGDSSHFGEGTDLRLSTHEVRVSPIGLANVWFDVAETGVRKVFERALGSPRGAQALATPSSTETVGKRLRQCAGGRSYAAMSSGVTGG